MTASRETGTTRQVHEPVVDPEWIALHVFYSSNSNPLLEECVTSLVAELRQSGLIDRYFFIRYWLEGPHIRLRLHPARASERAIVLTRAQETIEGYIRSRPSLYRLDPELLGSLYREMFLMEYSEEEWNARYGEDGEIPLHESNTVIECDYEPEYVKYGGPVGVHIAEQHFEQSSDLVLQLIATTNVHVRNVMFGLAIQTMALTTATFLPDRDDAARFHERYQTMWETTLLSASTPTRDGFETNYLEMADQLADRLSTIDDAVHAGQADQLPGFLGAWGAHCRDLRRGIIHATEAGGLVFPDGFPTGERRVVTDPDRTLSTLLVPFIHMTNNRLGVSIVEEVYLSHLLARYLSDSAAKAST